MGVDGAEVAMVGVSRAATALPALAVGGGGGVRAGTTILPILPIPGDEEFLLPGFLKAAYTRTARQ
jgi:hypothetical protein